MEVDGLGFAYDAGPEVLRDISFRVEPGRIVSILGPNGAGKTTLLLCMARLARPRTGSIRIGGKDAYAMSPAEAARLLGFVPQGVQPAFAYGVLDYVVTGCAPRLGLFQKPGDEEYAVAREALGMLGLTHLSDKPYTKISGGERQLASIARALAQRTGILLMDEPTAHLDYGNQVKTLRVIKTLAGKGYSIVMTTHNPEHAMMLGDQVAVIDRNGGFTFGHHADVISGEFLSSLYDTGIEVRRIDDIGRAVCLAHPF